MADKKKPDNMLDLRRRIDRLDRELVELLNRRARVVLRIGEIKNTDSKDVYVPAREKEVLDNVLALNRGPLTDEALQAIYREIMSASLAMERTVRVAYLGPQATFSHQAARSRFGASVDYQSCETIADVFAAVLNRRADYGVVPIENSIEGAV
ncbi:MAG: chorismate mutase, partial [Lentisphaerae bacterium]|nr:chorismate mutase [Lentisphaerota bacterium]